MENCINWKISILTTVQCRPGSIANYTQQNEQKQLRPSEKLIFPEILQSSYPTRQTHPSQQSKMEENTREILRKIEEVNTKQGYQKRKWGPKDSRPPYSYYSRSQFQNDQNNMELIKYAMANPILEYLKSQNRQVTQTKVNTIPRLRTPFNHQSIENDNQHDNNNQEAENQNQPIRQVTYYQVLAMPNPYFNPQINKNMFNNLPPHYQQLPNPPPPYENNLYNPNQSNDLQQEGRQNWNWPGANLFPIYIRDPFLQMYYAVTNMIEYGPNAGSGGPCKLTPTRGKNTQETKLKSSSRIANAAEIFSNPLSSDYIDVEDILANDESDLSFTVKNAEPIRSREATGNEIIVKSRGKPFIYTAKNAKSHAQITAKQHSNTIESPPQVSPEVFLDSLEETEIEAQKNDINVSNQGSRKVFSKDNTGNGIFIHKIRVKQGGVAIAGPGGIASAGDGGTAIVGANGIAYTTSEGTAIAGTGGKVIGTDNNLGIMDIIRTAIQQSTTNTTTESSKPKPETVARPNSNNKPNRPSNPFFNFNNNNNKNG